MKNQLILKFKEIIYKKIVKLVNLSGTSIQINKSFTCFKKRNFFSF